MEQSVVQSPGVSVFSALSFVVEFWLYFKLVRQNARV
jgi:hypothetical protein